jgi:methylglutaconyl-CoA hydratase
MTFTMLAIERQDAVGIITLNRPQQHNAFDDALIAELTLALEGLRDDPDVRVVVLSAAGKSFSAGADLNWMRRMATYDHASNLADSNALARLMHTLDTLPKPTIARVQGSAFGGGVGLVACCDMAIAVMEAQFSLSEVKLGLIPAVISPYVIAAIGARNARRYFLTAERFPAAEAYRMGLIHDLASSEADLDEKIEALVAALLTNSPAAIKAAKQLIGDVALAPVDEALRAETASRIAAIRASAEGREGLTAFLEKRTASWVRS